MLALRRVCQNTWEIQHTLTYNAEIWDDWFLFKETWYGIAGAEYRRLWHKGHEVNYIDGIGVRGGLADHHSVCPKFRFSRLGVGDLEWGCIHQGHSDCKNGEIVMHGIKMGAESKDKIYDWKRLCLRPRDLKARYQRYGKTIMTRCRMGKCMQRNLGICSGRYLGWENPKNCCQCSRDNNATEIVRIGIRWREFGGLQLQKEEKEQFKRQWRW